MDLLNIEEYKNSIIDYSNCDIDWNMLKNKNFLISGATGMIGKCLIDIIMYKNEKDNLNCNIIALGRNKEKAKDRLGNYFDNKNFKFIESDINKEINIEEDNIDYILHAASSTHPLQYSNDPIGTITANVLGTYNLLNLASKKNNKRFLFASSVEVYGENKGDTDKFDENYLGYIDCNTLRAGYPESKRTGEALCQAFIKQKDMDIVIARLSRVFGPTMLMSDSKASSQFIKNGINEEDIVLKSEGLQNYSYSYVFDAVIGMMLCLTKGKIGEAYNIGYEKFDVTLREFAKACADTANKEVIFDLPDENEKAGYSTATKALLDSSKIGKLGYRVKDDFTNRVKETIKILKKMK
ncbi:MAG: NAD-dependent epimerase/dehydratase family protein [Bacilli bacterium]|nr:NAD-dependent epimerase/dehydratase family protein [Bacilli bacterium]